MLLGEMYDRTQRWRAADTQSSMLFFGLAELRVLWYTRRLFQACRQHVDDTVQTYDGAMNGRSKTHERVTVFEVFCPVVS